MSASNPELSLEMLAARLDMVERENQTLRSQLAAFTEAKLSNADASSHSPMERLSRRWVLRRGLQVAAATAAAGVLAQRTVSDASADHTGEGVHADLMSAHEIRLTAYPDLHAVAASSNSSSRATIWATNTATMPAVYGESASGNGAVEGKSLHVDGKGVWGRGRIGVFGISSHGSGSGVYGDNTNNIGVEGKGRIGVMGTTSVANYTAVVGEHKGTVGFGVLGQATGAGYGVTGRSPAGEGVHGEGPIGVNGVSATPEGWGVRGEGDVGVVGWSGRHGYEGVYGGHTGSFGYGVVGDGVGGAAGVLGRSPAGEGVRGEGRTGISARATGTAGYGALIQGGKAQLRLFPMSTAGKPTSGSHVKGEIYLDSAGTIFICTSPGTPGTWRKVTTSPA